MARAVLVAFVVALALPIAAQQIDSPLVALAKRTNRLGKKPAHVITNEEVAASRGRISEVGAPDAEVAQANTAPAKSSNSPAAPGGSAAADTALARIARQMAASAPQPVAREGSTRASYSIPQSSATNATVTSSATTSTGRSTAQDATVRSTASSTQMDQTARTSSPPVVPGTKVE